MRRFPHEVPRNVRSGSMSVPRRFHDIRINPMFAAQWIARCPSNYELRGQFQRQLKYEPLLQSMSPAFGLIYAPLP